MVDTMAASPIDDIDALHDEAATVLGRVDQRYTDGRRRLIGMLSKAGRPVTLPEIIDLDPDLPQSSVYRNLDVLEQVGLVRRLTVGNEHARFELSEPLLGHHHHLICVVCGMIEDVRLGDEFEHLLDTTLATAANTVGFTPLHHSLDLHGYCASCPSPKS